MAHQRQTANNFQIELLILDHCVQAAQTVLTKPRSDKIIWQTAHFQTREKRILKVMVKMEMLNMKRKLFS
jgi:hypothetical protein